MSKKEHTTSEKFASIREVAGFFFYRSGLSENTAAIY
jgi:hypothetical protein